MRRKVVKKSANKSRTQVRKVCPRKELQKRADDLKTLEEQRADLVQEMKSMTSKAKEEQRAFSDEEDQKFEELSNKVKKLDSTIEKIERARDIELNVVSDEKKKELKTEEMEERAFEAYIRGNMQQRAEDMNLTASDNGAVIPASIVNKIIKKVEEICPIYQMATRYNTGGNLTIPYYDEEEQSIKMAYANEFEELTSTSGKFKNIELKGFLAGALSKISKSLVNNSSFDIVSFVISAMAEAISRFIERELLNGTDEKIEGLSKVKRKVTARAATVLTTDELIDLQEEVPDVFQENSIWIMNKNTRKAIRKLKDNEGRYILNPDPTAKWGYTLFGKDVYTSANMPEMAAGAKTIYYGDMTGLAVKVSEEQSIEVLREKFATQHAVGVVAWIEMDSKIEHGQKIAALEMASA